MKIASQERIGGRDALGDLIALRLLERIETSYKLAACLGRHSGPHLTNLEADGIIKTDADIRSPQDLSLGLERLTDTAGRPVFWAFLSGMMAAPHCGSGTYHQLDLQSGRMGVNRSELMRRPSHQKMAKISHLSKC